MPFAYVDWNALQSDVVDGGATFMIQKMAMGANQEMEPTGDVAYVACGPFECVSGDSSVTAPEITTADDDSYANWDPMLEISYGWVDNDVFPSAADTDDTADDGIDLGWITSSTLGMGVKHTFNGVPDGTNFDVEGPDAKGDRQGHGRSPLDDRRPRRYRRRRALTTAVSRIPDGPWTTPTSQERARRHVRSSTVSIGLRGTRGGLMVSLLQPDECFKIRR